MGGDGVINFVIVVAAIAAVVFRSSINLLVLPRHIQNAFPWKHQHYP